MQNAQSAREIKVIKFKHLKNEKNYGNKKQNTYSVNQ